MMKAKYAGRCLQCGEAIAVGQEIHFLGSGKGAMHFGECSDAYSARRCEQTADRPVVPEQASASGLTADNARLATAKMDTILAVERLVVSRIGDQNPARTGMLVKMVADFIDSGR